VECEKLSDGRLGEPSAAIRGRAAAAREWQSRRFEGTRLTCNADMGPAEVRDFCQVDPAGKSLLKAAMQQLQMSAPSGPPHPEAGADDLRPGRGREDPDGASGRGDPVPAEEAGLIDRTSQHTASRYRTGFSTTASAISDCMSLCTTLRLSWHGTRFVIYFPRASPSSYHDIAEGRCSATGFSRYRVRNIARRRKSMTRRMLPRITLFVLLVLLVSPVPPPVLPSAPSAANYLLVYRSSVFFGEDDTPSRALLITDLDEIRKVHALMSPSVYTGHTCGFHWSVTFWASPSESVDGFSINEACDHYDPQLKPYFQQLRDRPTHFIYDLKIPVDIHPEQVIRTLQERNLVVFLLHGPNPHLPHITVAVSPPGEDGKEVLVGSAQRGEARLRSIVEAIAEEYPVKILGKIYCPDYRYRGKPGCSTQATVWFERGADLTGITDSVEARGGRMWGKSIPSTYYDVQLVVDEQDLEQVQQTILSELEYVADVSRYNPLPPSRSAPVDTLAAEPSEEWIIECVDCPKQFYRMTDRSLRLDAAGHPHMAYGEDHLYYAWHDGVSWHYETADDAPGVGMSASLALDGTGFPHISYYDRVNGNLRYANRDASGWHVETVDSAGDIGKYTSIALDEAGFPHISYHDGSNENLKYAYKSASGWHTETVDDSRGFGWHTSLTLDGAGYPHIGYYGDMYSSVQYAHQDASGWHIETVDRPVSHGGNLSLVLDGAGYAHISYDTGRPDDALKYAYQDASGWHIETVDSGGFNEAYTSLVLDRDGYPHVSYYNWDSGPLKYAYRDASGWHVETVDSERGELRSTSLALDDNGRPHIGYHAWSHAALRYARRDLSGWHVETMDSEGDLGRDTSLVVDEQGYPHISYKQYDGGLKYAYQDASGWHAWIVDNTRYAGGDNSLALDGDGYAHISYYQGGDTALKYACQDALGWHTEIVDNTGYVGTDTSLALDESGYPHISYCDQDNNDLKYAYQDGSGWHLETVDSKGDVGWSTSLVLDGHGYAHVSYFDWGNGDLKYAYQDASGWHIEAVDADKGDQTSLALDGSGYPHISYYGARALKYAYQDASGWHVEMVDDVGDPGWYTSLVLDGNGNPHISYNDRAGVDLKYAYHDASGWHIETVDSEGDVGAFASLALDGTGKPRISYHDSTDGDLKYAFKNGAVRSVDLLDDRGDGGLDISLTPTPEQPVPRSQDFVDLGCIYLGETIVLDAEMWGRYGVGARLSSGQYGASIADSKICWYKGEDLPEHLPFPLPSAQEAEATPTETPFEGPTCRDLVTPDRIGEEDFEQFAIGEKLVNDQFQRDVSEDQIACWYQRVIDGAIVEGDRLYYLFDLEAGALLKKQVWWRSDLAEHLPSPLITREEAEAVVEGEVQYSMLVIIHPDTDTFRELKSSPGDSDTIETTKPTKENPCWLVYSYTNQAGGDRVTRLTVVDAVTGEMLGYTDLQ